MPTPKVLVFSSRSPAEGGLKSLLAGEGYRVEWTDSGPEAICGALDGELSALVIFVGRHAEREEYIPCLNRVDPDLPVIVVSEQDSLEFQRRLRRHRVFYYLPEPFDAQEVLAALRSAVRPPSRRRRA